MADMDEFAQTRGADDLFDDEIIPVSAEEQQAQVEVVVAAEPEPEPAPRQEETTIEKQPPTRGDTSHRDRGGDRDRGRGRGRGQGQGQGRGKGRGLQDSRWADNKPAEKSPRLKGPKTAKEPGTPKQTEPTTPDKPKAGLAEAAGQDDEGQGEDSVSNGTEPQRVPAVRGDRSATGGVRKVSKHQFPGRKMGETWS